MKLSLIISFYNKINYLKLVLAGLSVQSYKDFEVIIADDGSDSFAVSEIEKLVPKYDFPILHVRHEKKGFRKNRILNKAVEFSGGDYLIFIDGDCIPHKEFINEHLLHSNDKFTLTGRRVNLSIKLTNNLSEEIVRKSVLDKSIFKIFYDSITGESNYAEKGIYIKSKILRNFVNYKSRGLLGCNFSVHKSNLLSINGFDERYEAPSIGEDSDIQFRLELNGIKVRSLNNIAVQYHLYHKLLDRSQKNLELFNKIRSDKIAFTPFGIEKQS